MFMPVIFMLIDLIWLKNTLSVMEESYSVKIPDSEVGYIYDIISSDY